MQSVWVVQVLVGRRHASLLLYARVSRGGVQLQIRLKCKTILRGREVVRKMLATATHCIPTTQKMSIGPAAETTERQCVWVVFQVFICSAWEEV